MKTNYFSILKSKLFLFFSVVLLSSVALISCSDDDDNKPGPAYFEIEGDPTGLSVDMNESTTSYVVRSNRLWEVVPQEEGDWVVVSPVKGKGSGPLEFTVKANETFVPRVMNFVFVVDGEEQPTMFRIEQEPGVAFLEVPASEDGLTVKSVEDKVVIKVVSNAVWDYSIDESWLSESSKTDLQLELVAEANQGPERVATVTFTSESIPGFSAEVKITQSSGDVVFEEDFSWLTYGDVRPYETSGEKRYDLWTQEEKDKGWEVTVNPASNDQPVYARPGFVKLGRTRYGSDFISPRLEAIDGVVDVVVTFKAMPYLTAGAGTKDDNKLSVSALNAGTVEEPSEFIIDNWPNKRSEDEEGIENDAWAPEVAERSFVIRGATSETQIRFLGGAFDLRGVGTERNRIFLDDIKVIIVQD